MIRYEPRDIGGATVLRPVNLDRTNRIFNRIAVGLAVLFGISILSQFAPWLLVFAIAGSSVAVIVWLILVSNDWTYGIVALQIVNSQDSILSSSKLAELDRIRSKSFRKRYITLFIIIVGFREGNFVAVRKNLKRLKKRKHNSEAFRILGLVEQVEGNHQNAIANFLWCLQQEYLISTAISLASSYCALGEYEKAEFYLFDLLERNSETIDCFYYLGLVYEYSGRPAESEKYFRFYLDSISDEKRQEIVDEIARKMNLTLPST